MSALIKRVCCITDERIYYSTWRIQGNEKSGMHKILLNNGFKEVVRNRVKYNSKYNCYKEYCPAKYSVDSVSDVCECYEDLWVRESKEQENERVNGV